ncbi:MAG: imidazole glycerol phosphate synthase subunit HisH [Clostridia bacterium]|nr:imidazole glycerol phosphate synthase subunit HisH [Clostridia bacterium]
MIAIVDYGVGNLFSLKSSFEAVGAEVVVTGEKSVIESADKIVLPGVGAFADAARKLRESGLAETVKAEAAKGKPLLGICLGMQLLFEESHEYGVHQGLGLIQGKVVSMQGVIPQNLQIPQIGWNALKFHQDHPVLKYIKEGDCVYFVHSYYATECNKDLLLSVEYGAEITAAVVRGNVLGMQFHPEKSGTVGLNLLRAFVEWEA